MPIGPNGEALPYPEDEAAMGDGVPPGLEGLLGGPPESIQVSPPEEEGPSGDPAGILRDILDLCREYQNVEQDDEDLLQIEKVTTLLQQLLANNQKEADGMMQGKMSPRGLRKALSG